MSNLRREDRDRSGEQGFTLIELLVVVTIIGILAAIVSVSVGGFTGKASVQAHKTTIKAVQAAVDAYIADHYDGSGAVVGPTGTADTFGQQDPWYDTNGSVLPSSGDPLTVKHVSIALLTQSTTSVLANTTRTVGPYLRLGGNASIACVFKNKNGASGPADPDGSYQVILCRDTAQTSQ